MVEAAIKQEVQARNTRLKALFIRAKSGATIEDIMKIAKVEAMKIGMGDTRFLRVLDIHQVVGLDGYTVVVQSLW